MLYRTCLFLDTLSSYIDSQKSINSAQYSRSIHPIVHMLHSPITCICPGVSKVRDSGCDLCCGDLRVPHRCSSFNYCDATLGCENGEASTLHLNNCDTYKELGGSKAIPSNPLNYAYRVDLTPQNTSELQKFTISVLYFSKQPNSCR